MTPEETIERLRGALDQIVSEYDRWKGSTDIQERSSMEWWLKDEIKAAREVLEEKTIK